VHWLEVHGSEAFQSPLILAAIVGGWCLWQQDSKMDA